MAHDRNDKDDPQSDEARIRTTHNTARYFTENRQVAWVLLMLTVLWGIYSYTTMPKRKDPDIPVRVAVALGTWPGASADKVEDLLTRRIEEKIAENSKIDRIESTTRTGVTVVTVVLQQSVRDTAKEFDDLRLRLDTLQNLPQGARIDFLKDFGDTTSLMLTVASPKVSEIEIQLRAERVRRAIEEVRARAPAEGPGDRATLIVCFPSATNMRAIRQVGQGLAAYAAAHGALDVQPVEGPGFLGIDSRTRASDDKIIANARRFASERLRASELHPDIWEMAVIRDPAETEARLTEVAGDKYTYRELDEFTDQLKRRLQTAKTVSKVTRSGVLPEYIFLDYSQERMASYGIQASQLRDVLGARNITAPGGVVEVQDKDIVVDPSGAFRDERDIGGVLVATSATGSPAYLRDLAEISRGYESPPRFLNSYTWRDPRGAWHRTRAATLAVFMRSGEQIGDFGQAVDAALAQARLLLPEDLIIARTSDQPRQVEENVELFMRSLYEAILLVVLVALIGFWEWRSALLMALSIPITLTMTFGLMRLCGVDLQQVSIASLIIALGLLVDDPVVAGDAIKRDLALGHPPVVSAWLGPTKLAAAILFATITNIVAYLPFLTLPDDSGRFIFSLPIVLTCSLVASRLVSMTFIPLLGYYLLRAPDRPEPPLEIRRQRGFARSYYRAVGWAVDHRRAVLGLAAVLFVAGALSARGLKQAFFPKDLSYLSYVDVWLPEDVPLLSTRQTARLVDRIIRDTAEEYGKAHPGPDGKPRQVLQSITTFAGAGGPRFWFSVTPEQRQLNYAQLIIQLRDKHDTSHFLVPLQRALSRAVPGARVDARQLESGAPVGVPVSIRISGEDIPTLRELAEKVRKIFLAIPHAERVRDNWGADIFSVRLEVDSDRANLAGVTNLDVANTAAGALNGAVVGSLRQGDEQIPIVARLRAGERAQLSDLENLYVNSGQSARKVPLRQISAVTYGWVTEKIVRRNQFRTITVSAFPAPGMLPSEVMAAARGALEALQRGLPPGYGIEVGGEEEEQKKGFKNLAVVLLISVLAIFLALVVQFRSAVKPLIVFAAIPFGAAGALASLAVMRAPFGFMAFLGIISLIGVIVSHVIVLFDFIEERHEAGEPLREALLDAGILRLRPVLITVGATVFGLVPLALHGGPLWEPLCYVQIGGLTLATGITLVLVPVLYATFVLDLKVVHWEERPPAR